MAQHFLLSRGCRDLPVSQVLRLSEDEAYQWFKACRWQATSGEPVCPHCAVLRCYELRRRRFRCSSCRTEFSVTSGTIFAFHKLSFGQILAAIAFSVNAVKGKAALHLSREIGVQYKTAWVLLMKIREALASRAHGMVLEGSVEIDAMQVSGHVRPRNRKADRVDRRRVENQSGKRLAVMAARERDSKGRTVPWVVRSENSDCAWDLVRHHVHKNAGVVADQHAAYDELVGLAARLTRVNHQIAYQQGEGINTNRIESFFSRVWRSWHGIHHRFSVKYLGYYVAELAWREDNRRTSNGHQTIEMLRRALAHPTSRNLCGYWQGNRPLDRVRETGSA